MKHYQVCFTRISGQGSGDGWQAVNASPELPQEAVSAFSRFQNGNIAPPSFDAEDAGSQIVTELQCDSNYVFYTLIKCNAAADDRGRPIMFADSFVFPLAEFVHAPQEVLCLERSNFSFDIAQTKALPLVLSRSPKYSLRETVDSLGLSEASYTTLVQCVYSIIDGKAKKSLHIICDCNPDTIKKLMICIYAALPFEFRKKITFSTYEFQSGTVKTLIFDRKIKSPGNYYVNPITGQNNILSDMVLKRLEKYEFMHFAPHNNKVDNNIDNYFKTLEEKLSLFGSAQTTSLDLYKIADDLILDDKSNTFKTSPEELCRRLNEFLSISSHPYIDLQIQNVLSEIVDHQLVLNDVISEKLCRKLETTENKDLIEVGYMYNSMKIGKMTVEDGANYLFSAYNNRHSESFIQIKKLLDTDYKGREILNYLYTKLITESMPTSKDNIVAFFEETQSLFDRSMIQESLYKLSCSYIKTITGMKSDPLMLKLEVNELLDTVLSDRPDLKEEAYNYFKQMYWKGFHYENLKIDCPNIYKDVELQEDIRCNYAFELMMAYKYFETHEVEELDSQVSNLFTSNNALITAEDQSALIKKLQTACLESRDVYDDKELDVWLVLAFLQCYEKKNPAKFMIENRLLPITKYFNEAYAKSTYLQDNGIKECFVDYLSEYAEEKTEDSKVASEALRIIKEHERRAKKDVKRQQQAEKIEAGKNSDRMASILKIVSSFMRNAFKKNK